jgi:hypothetical protein
VTSLRLAEAFTRAATPEGHQIRSLQDLREHMSGAHDLDVAHMLPQRVLMSMHEQDHSEMEPPWSGSSDSYRPS